MYEIFSIGHTNFDHIINVEKFADEGSPQKIQKYNRYHGGTGANVALVASRLGAETGLYSPVGYDFVDTVYFNYMKYDDNCLANLKIVSDLTSECFIFTDSEGVQKSYISEGASEYFNKAPIPKECIDKSEVVHITTVPPTYAKKCTEYTGMDDNIIVSFNPGQALHSYTFEQLSDVLQGVDILFCNENEFYAINKKLKQHPFELGVEYVVKTLGKKGSTIFSKDEESYWDTRPFEVDAVDPTGAGDSYQAGFLYALINGAPIHECGIFGSAVASFIVEKEGCQTNMPTLDQVKERAGDFKWLPK